MKRSEYANIFNEVWAVFRADVDSISSSDEFWKSVLDKYQALVEKHENTEQADFVKDIALLCMGELEKIYKSQLAA